VSSLDLEDFRASNRKELKKVEDTLRANIRHSCEDMDVKINHTKNSIDNRIKELETFYNSNLRKLEHLG